MKKRNDPSEILPKVSLGRHGACEESDFKIDTSLIPDQVKEELASATLEAVTAFLRQPGGREIIAAETAARKA